MIRLRLLLSPLLVSLWLLIGCGGDPTTSNLLLISLDTLRSSELGAYGSDGAISPQMDRLAEEGALFEQALATSPWTLPSHASLFTGLYPSRHGMIRERSAMPDSLFPLAEILSSHGFQTSAVVNAPFLNRARGFDRGFGEYVVVNAARRHRHPFEVGEKVVDWLRKRPQEPFFLFWHDYFPHSPYEALPEYREADARSYRGEIDGSEDQLRRIREEGQRLADTDRDQLLSLYRSGVRQIDHQVGRVVAELREMGVSERTLIVLVSDHGEEIFEHGSVLHGRTQYEEVLRIPFILRGPGVPAGVRVSESVSLIDVLPTALSLLGVAAVADLDGIDLSPWIRGEGGEALSQRFVFSEADHNNLEHDVLRSVRRGRYKLIYDRLREEGELFDLLEDPRERIDRWEELEEVRESLFGELERFMAKSPAQTRLLPELSSEERAELEALGYGN